MIVESHLPWNVEHLDPKVCKVIRKADDGKIQTVHDPSSLIGEPVYGRMTGKKSLGL